MTAVAPLYSTGMFNYTRVKSTGFTGAPVLSCFVEYSCAHVPSNVSQPACLHIALAKGKVNKTNMANTLKGVFYELVVNPAGDVGLRRAADGNRWECSATGHHGAPFTFNTDTQKFWLEFNRETGRFCFGAGDVFGQSLIVDWTDPQPLAVEFAAANIYDNTGEIQRAMLNQPPECHFYNTWIKFFPPLRWSVQQHAVFPDSVRSQARELLKIGWTLARAFAGQEQALVDCWVESVMPHALGLSHSTRFNKYTEEYEMEWEYFLENCTFDPFDEGEEEGEEEEEDEEEDED